MSTSDPLTRRIFETRYSLIEYAAEHTLKELLTRVLDTVGDLVNSPIGFYHLVEPDGKTLSLQQWSTRTLREFCRAEGEGMHYSIDEAGVWVDCVRQRKPVIHNDYASFPHKKGLPPGHGQVIRELVVPVMRGGKVVAILGVGNKPVEYTQSDADIVSFFADVTWEVVQRKRAQEGLRESEGKYRALFEKAPNPVFIVDDSGRYLDANEEALRFLECSREELLKKNVWDFSPPHLLENQKQEHAPFTGPRMLETDYWVNGSVKTLLLSVAPLRVQGRTVLYGIGQDITDHRQAREKIEHLNRVLMAVRNVNQLITREKDTGRLISSACSNLTDTRGYDSAWIVLFDPDRKPSFRAQSGLDGRFASLIEALEENGMVPCVDRTLARPGVTVTREPGSSCTECPVSDSYGGRWSMGTRLEHGGKVYGLLCASLPPGLAEDEDEQALFSEVAGDIAFALQDIELEQERKHNEELLRCSEERFRTLFDGAADALFLHDLDGRFIAVNKTACDRLGYSREELTNLTPRDIDAPEYAALVTARIEELKTRGHCVFEAAHITKDGYRIPIELSSRVIEFEGRPAVLSVARDIRERKQAEAEKETTLYLLRALSRENGQRALIREVTALMRNWSGCEAVGVRLQEGDDYPYFETRGFPQKFVEAERHLCVPEGDADVLRDSRGNPVLECMCGNVIRGRFDPGLPFFTEQGSFWTNSTTDLLASTTQADRQARTRNRCNGEGYESVALVPLRCGGQTLGLLQFNDWRRGMFDERKIGALERLASNLAIGILQRKAAEALRENRRLLNDAERLAGLGAWSWDIQRDVWELSENWRALHGFSRSAMTTDELMSAAHPDDAEAIRREFEKVKSGQGNYQIQHRIIRQDNGEVRVIQAFGEPRRGADGRIKRIVGAALDVTHRMSVEKALRSERDRAQKYLDVAGVIFVAINADEEVTLINRKGGEVLGYSQEEIVGKKWFDTFLPERGREQVKADFRRLMAGEITAVQHYENPVINRQGEERMIAWHNTVLRDDKGGIVGTLSSGEDVTERRQAEEALLRSEKRLKEAQKTGRIGDVELDVVSGSVYWSDFTFELYERDKRLGLPPYQEVMSLHHPDDARRMEECVRRAIEHAEPYNLDLRVQLPSGRTGYYHAIGTPVVEEGRVVRITGTVQDITERKLAEQENIRLEEQFHQAQKLESVGRLAGGIAHDLNNLLTPILGYSEMLLEDTGPSDPRIEPLEDILNAGKRARDLVRQLLAFSRRQVLEFKPVNLDSLLKNFEKLLRRTIREDVRMHLELGSSLPKIRGDTGQLEQVIMNLAVNAQDAMPGGGDLVIQTSRTELNESDVHEGEGIPPGTYVLLTVKDTGQGMDAGTREHLFEPFFTTKEKDEGTGLGLATVYGIVKQHGGSIRVSSESGAGTTFRIFLPVLQEADPDRTRREEEARVQGGSETILLVEDNERVRRLIQAMMLKQGYTVLSASGGNEALELLSRLEEPLHLLVTDVIMPDMNGKQLYERVSSRFNEVKVLYISGYTDNVIAQHGILDEGVHLIQKPFSNKALSVKLREILD
jgi:PAS domain S-box-containing protein